jgi:hypothetical protein
MRTHERGGQAVGFLGRHFAVTHGCLPAPATEPEIACARARRARRLHSGQGTISMRLFRCGRRVRHMRRGSQVAASLTLGEAVRGSCSTSADRQICDAELYTSDDKSLNLPWVRPPRSADCAFPEAVRGHLSGSLALTATDRRRRFVESGAAARIGPPISVAADSFLSESSTSSHRKLCCSSRCS